MKMKKVNEVLHSVRMHNSGTKFYEVLHLSPKVGDPIEIRRFGKLDALWIGGGQGNVLAGLSQEVAKGQIEKKRKGGYTISPPVSSEFLKLVDALREFESDNEVSLRSLLKDPRVKNWLPAKLVEQAVLHCHASSTPTKAEVSPAAEPPKERSGDWGSW